MAKRAFASVIHSNRIIDGLESVVHAQKKSKYLYVLRNTFSPYFTNYGNKSYHKNTISQR